MVEFHAQEAARIVKPDGTLIFNDYTMADQLTRAMYGVVHAVNELVVSTGWKVVGFPSAIGSAQTYPLVGKWQGDLFRARLDQIINMERELVQLAAKIDWSWIDGEMAPLYSDTGRPGIENRFVLLLKHMFGLSDEAVCEHWVYDPYFQHFTGETFFQHTSP